LCGLRNLVRIGLVLVLGMLIIVRAFDFAAFVGAVDGPMKSVAATLDCTLLSAPRYFYLPAASESVDDTVVLAAVHCAVSLYVELGIWSIAIALIGLVALDALQRESENMLASSELAEWGIRGV
jgi:hypothetical protein